MPHYSPSQIGMFERCPRQWRFRYVDGLRLPPAGAMVMGTANHRAQEAHFRQILDGTGPGLDGDGYESATADAYEVAAEEVDWTHEENDRGKVKDVAIQIARQYRAARVDFLGAPVAVEPKIDLAIPGAEWTLRTILDLATNNGEAGITIRDLKCKRKAPNGASKGTPELDAAHATQLLLYAHAWESETGARPAAVVEYAWPRGVAPVPVPFRAAEVGLVLEEIDIMHRQILAGLFPRKRNGWHCSPRACGYWDRCLGSILTDR